MNMFLQHKFEQVKNNFNYSFCAPVGASFDDAKEVLKAILVQLDAIEKSQKEKAAESAAEPAVAE